MEQFALLSSSSASAQIKQKGGREEEEEVAKNVGFGRRTRKILRSLSSHTRGRSVAIPRISLECTKKKGWRNNALGSKLALTLLRNLLFFPISERKSVVSLTNVVLWLAQVEKGGRGGGINYGGINLDSLT